MGNRSKFILILGFILLFRGAIGQTLPDACPGSMVRYSVQGLPNSTFSWNVLGGTIITSYNDSVDILWGSKPGTFQLSVVELSQFNCTGPQVIASVNVGGDTANLGGNQAICVGNTATFTPDKPFAKYLWSDGSAQSSLQTGIPGIVWVEVTNAAGCVSRDSVALTVNQPTAIDLGADRPVCGDSGILLSGPLQVSNWTWTIRSADGSITTENTPSVHIDKAVGIQTVSLEIVDFNGCTNSDTVKMLECGAFLGIMNTITADNNGINDIWKISNIENHQNAVISLYDRWGRLVYIKNGNYQNNDANGFKGIGSNGKALPMDSYFYVIDLKDGSKPVTGYLLIIK